MGPFEVSKETVGGLGDELLRRLLQRLLEAETARLGISASCISVGGNQTAPDGGVDASIVWNGGPKADEWLPRRMTVFQCKAEIMGPKALAEEICPKGVVRPVFESLARRRGAYVIFSTDDPTALGLQRRVAAMREALADVAGHERLSVDFYGADKIARWTNQHLGVAIWLISETGRSVAGWRPLDNWSAPGSGDSPYLVDESRRVTVDGVDVDVLSVIAKIREVLSAPGGAVRLIGISGMGKTRLAEALFDARLLPGTELPRHRAIYGDVGLDLAASPALLTEQITLGRVDAVIIVDNCSARAHRQLAEIVLRRHSRASLLTIDYDLGDDNCPGTTLVGLAENSGELMAALLEQRHSSLNPVQRQHIAKISGGNARIALRIADGAGSEVDLSTLRDSELLDRLFQSGRQDLGRGVRRCADAASLVNAFFIEKTKFEDAEHSVLAASAGVSNEDFFRNVAVLLEWGVVQQRGAQRAVMPPPLANMLAAEFVRRSDTETLLARFLAGPERLFASFARRLGQLDSEPRAVQLVQRLLAPDGVLGDLRRFGAHDHWALAGAAPAAEEAALRVIENALAESNERILPGLGSDRYHYPRLLVHLAYEPHLFGRAMEALLALVLIDEDDELDAMMDETDPHDRSIDYLFLQRFRPSFSNTLADLPIRLQFLDRLLADCRVEARFLGVRALDQMLQVKHLSNNFESYFGSKSRQAEWRPIDPGDRHAWYGSAYDRIERIAIEETEEGNSARDVLAFRFQEGLEVGFPERSLAVMRRVGSRKYWHLGWQAVANTLDDWPAALGPELRSETAALEAELRPRMLDECFEAFVAGDDWLRSDSSKRRDFRLLAAGVGRALAHSGSELVPYLRRALSLYAQMHVDAFGRALVRHSNDFDMVWKAACEAFSEVEGEKRNPKMLGGILQEIASHDPALANALLDQALADPDLWDHAVELHVGRRLDAVTAARFSHALDLGWTPPLGIEHLAWYGTADLSAPALAAFLLRLFEREGWASPAIPILARRLREDHEAGRPVASEFSRIARIFLVAPETYFDDLDDDYIASIAELVLEGDRDRETVITMCRALRQRKPRKNVEHWGEEEEVNYLCRFLMRAYPLIVLDEIVAEAVPDYVIEPFLGGVRLDDDSEAYEDRDVEESKSRFDEQIVLDWVRKDPMSRAVRVAKFVPYARRDRKGGALGWSDLALQIIAAAPDPVPVLTAFELRLLDTWGDQLVARRSLIAALLDHPLPAVAAWSRISAIRLEDRIRYWAEEERAGRSRFE